MKEYKNKLKRRDFLRLASVAGASLSVLPLMATEQAKHIINTGVQTDKRIGIIGLDTSHSEIFTRMINTAEVKNGYKVVAAYSHGSPDIVSALQMKPQIIEAVKTMGVEIVESIEELLTKVDFVLLESNDGRPHYEQALPVLRAGKRMFIDKPVAHNLKDAQRIFQAAKQYNTPIFSSSALRYEENTVKVRTQQFGKVIGADVYTPAEIDTNHLDFAWYGIHGVEMLYTLMGTGCDRVIRAHTEGTDVITAIWKDGRVGTVRGIRQGMSNIAGTAFCENGIQPVGPFTTYAPLVEQILRFFDTGIAPISPEETLEIFRFLHAADKSKATGKYVKV